MSMSQFIRSDFSGILARYADLVQPGRHDPGLDQDHLRSVAAEILTWVADLIESHDRHQVSYPLGDRPQFAERAEELYRGLSLTAVTGAYRALRTSVTQHWASRAGSLSSAQHDEISCFNECLDDLLAQAMLWYDNRLEHVEAQLENVARLGDRRHRALAELSPDAILVHDGHHCAYANVAAAKLIGFDAPRDLVGEKILAYILPEYHDAAADLMRGVLAGKTSPPVEYRLKKRGGEIIDVDVVAGPTPWKGKTAAQVIVRDITQRKQTEAMLREAERNKDDFLALLAHELRNPLAPIQSGIETLRLSTVEPAVAGRVLEMMGRQTLHLKRLVDDLMDVSRISRGKLNLAKEPADLVEITRRAVDAMSSVIAPDRRRLEINLAPEAVWVEADPVRLVQIVENLLDNAAKYTAVDGLIHVSVTQQRDQARVSVRDDGAGIAPEMVSEIFDMFRQVDGRAQGLGVGLSLVKQISEAHGGSVEVRSQGAGCGSEFSIVLPLSNQPCLDPEPSLGEAQVPLTGRRVLVVDDNQDAADSLSLLLDMLGGDVRTVNDGPAALAVLDDFGPQTVLLDIGMPGMDGYEVAEAIRGRERAREIILVAVTGRGQDGDRARARAAGFDYHLTKPVEIEQIKWILAGDPEMGSGLD